MLLERDRELAALREALARAADRRGSVVLVTGEAGIGKSTLVRAWIADPGAKARVLVGWCDDFLTNRALGPLHDVARTTGGALAAAVQAGDIGAVLDATLDEVSYPLAPTLLLLEDMHWADDASLDVVRYVGRRITHLPAVLALTYRDDEVTPSHPLYGVLGALSISLRIALPPLSGEAVRQLTSGTELDAEEIVRVTGGNPFFVTELTAQKAEVPGIIPASICDAVLARVRKLSKPAQEAVEALAVVPGGADDDVVRVLGLDRADIASAERAGVVVLEDDTVRFRHELARDAVLASLPATVRREHHRRVLAHLLASGAESASILHHAVGAGRSDVIATHGPPAAAEAHHAGAYREAVAHHERVLAHPELLAPGELALVVEEYAWALYSLQRLEEAAAAARRAIVVRTELGDDVGRIRALLLSARMSYILGQPEAAFAAADQARALLSASSGSELRAEVLTQRLALLHLTGRHAAVLVEEAAERDLVEQAARADARVYLRVYGAGSRVMLGNDGALAGIVDALALGHRDGLLEPVARAYTNLVLFLVLLRRWDAASERIEEAIAFFDDHDFRTHRYSTVAEQARMLIQLGDWDAAAVLLDELSTASEHPGVLEAGFLSARATLAVRSGAGNASELIASAWKVCVASRSEYLVPTACTAIEWAWLAQTPDLANSYVDRAEAVAEGTVLLGPLRWRLPLVGRVADASGVITEPERVSLSGNRQAAAQRWQALHMPFEQAVELLQVGTQETTLAALQIFERLGAQPAARMARRQLRDLGMRSIPRGPAASTRQNPLGLTDRQVDVLELLTVGLTNAEIADRLVVSVRTVDHHVSTILRKLGVTSRKDAAKRAAGLRHG